MSNRTPWFATTILAFLVIAPCAFAQGTILWDESVNGPLSEDSSHPTVLNTFQLGTNSVLGSTEVVPTPPNWAGHPNIFTIQVPSTLSLTAIYLHVDKPNVWAWIGDPGFSSQMAFVMNPSSGELLSQWGLSSIGPGTYGMYLENFDQQSVTSIANFRLDFFAQNIPEPETISLFVVGLGLLGFRRWHKMQTHQR